MITPAFVAAVGPVDVVAMHMDLDGLYAGAKWVLGGIEPYEGADADARAVDTRQVNRVPSPRASIALCAPAFVMRRSNIA